MKAVFIALVLLLSACAPDDPTAVLAESSPLVPLDGPRLLRRMSLDLRGTLPSREEIEAVATDPVALDGLREQMLADPRHQARLVALFSEWLRTGIDEHQVHFYDYRLPDELECRFDAAVGQEPTRLMAEVATTDQPWSEIVTADWTMSNDLLAKLWPQEWPEGQIGWHETTYTDARPGAGVLSTNGLWWRYVTSKSNANRSRAAALSNLFLCMDFLARPVTFSTTPSLADPDGTAAALATNPACIACHASVDPLAATLFGFYPAIDYNTDELGRYHPEREAAGALVLGHEPGYFGQPLTGLADLGDAIAADSRFYACTTKRMTELLWRRPTQSDDFNTLDDLRERFIAGDGATGDYPAQTARLSALLVAITDTPEYRAGDLASPEDAEASDENTARLMTAAMLDSALHDLGGFRWVYNECDMLDNDELGYRVLVGGTDGDKVGEALQDPGLTWALTIKRLSQGFAADLVKHRFAEPARKGPELRRPLELLDGVTQQTRPADPAFLAAIEDLHWRLYAVAPTDEALADETALWTEVNDSDGPETAWIALLSALLRDPAFVSY